MADNTRGGSQDAGDPLIATDEVTYSGDTADVQLVRVVGVTGDEGSKTVVDPTLPVSGDVAHDDADSGNPVKIGGVYKDTPAAVSATGDRTEAITDQYGQLRMVLGDRQDPAITGYVTPWGALSVAPAIRVARVDAEDDDRATLLLDYNAQGAGYGPLETRVSLYNGDTWDRMRGDATDGLLVNLGPNNDVTVAGTVAVTQSGTWDEVGINDSGNSITVDAPAGTPVNVQVGDGTFQAGVVNEAGTSAVDALAVGGGTPHDSVDTGYPLKIGGKASGSAPTDVVNGDRVNAWYLRNGAAATVLTAAGDLIGGDAANGLDVDVTRLPSLPAGTNNIGDVDVLTLPALPAGNNNIGDVDIASSVTLTTKLASGTATLSNVASSASSVTLLASNANRLGATVHNDSTQVLYVKFGTTASSTSYTVKMVADAYYEVPYGYTGRIDGIWASANGNARVTEMT